jgi:tetratricopeptide (TPR) repeat protein
MERRRRHRPVWQPSRLSRLNAFVKATLRKISLGRLAIAIFVLPILLYVYREVTRDVLIIDPFTVPKNFEAAGLTSEVMANRIGDALRQIEEAVAETRMKKDNPTSLRDEGSTPDVEIPGTKLGLKAVIDITRTFFGIYPEHISGDIVVPVNAPANADLPPAKQQATVTIYVTQGRNRSAPVRVIVAADDVEKLMQRTAETVLGRVNPYLLASYREDHQEYAEAIGIVERMVQDPSVDRRHRGAALQLWGIVLYDQEKYDEAIAKYQKAIELDPKDTDPYSGWGTVLSRQRKYDEAIAKYQKAIELDPKDAYPYNGWGNVLLNLKKYDEAVAKYQKAIEIDPKDTDPYNGWGNALRDQKKYDEAVAKYQKAIELDPKDAYPYNGWGNVLYDQKKYDEALAKYQKAIELDPKFAVPYNGWGNVLLNQKKYDEAIAKYQKAIELDPKFAAPYYGWARVLRAQGKSDEAAAKSNKAAELSRSQ